MQKQTNSFIDGAFLDRMESLISCLFYSHELVLRDRKSHTKVDF